MRLLRLLDGEIQLTEAKEEFPRYAILSHTWGAAEDEVMFPDSDSHRMSTELQNDASLISDSLTTIDQFSHYSRTLPDSYKRSRISSSTIETEMESLSSVLKQFQILDRKPGKVADNQHAKTRASLSKALAMSREILKHAEMEVNTQYDLDEKEMQDGHRWSRHAQSVSDYVKELRACLTNEVAVSLTATPHFGDEKREETMRLLADTPHIFDWKKDRQNFFNEWLADSRPMYWIQGKSGTGKSALMKYAMDTFKKTPRPDMVVSYFFHHRSNPVADLHSGCFSAILRQIITSLSDIRTDIWPRLLPDAISRENLNGGRFVWDSTKSFREKWPFDPLGASDTCMVQHRLPRDWGLDILELVCGASAAAAMYYYDHQRYESHDFTSSSLDITLGLLPIGATLSHISPAAGVIGAIGLYGIATGCHYCRYIHEHHQDKLLVGNGAVGMILGIAVGWEVQSIVFRILPAMVILALITSTLISNASRTVPANSHGTAPDQMASEKFCFEA